MRWSNLGDVTSLMQRLYEVREWAPFWLRSGVPTSCAHGVVAVLAAAETRGLHATDYDAGTLVARLATASDTRHALAGEQAALFDVALTANVLRFAHALRFGRVRVTDVHAALHVPQDTMDLTAFVQTLAEPADASHMGDPGTLNAWTQAQFDTLEPPWTHYWLLRHFGASDVQEDDSTHDPEERPRERDEPKQRREWRIRKCDGRAGHDETEPEERGTGTAAEKRTPRPDTASSSLKPLEDDWSVSKRRAVDGDQKSRGSGSMPLILRHDESVGEIVATDGLSGNPRHAG